MSWPSRRLGYRLFAKRYGPHLYYNDEDSCIFNKELCCNSPMCSQGPRIFHRHSITFPAGARLLSTISHPHHTSRSEFTFWASSLWGLGSQSTSVAGLPRWYGPWPLAKIRALSNAPSQTPVPLFSLANSNTRSRIFLRKSTNQR